MELATDTSSPTAAYRAAVEAGDVAALAACVTPDITLKSPITDRFAFVGKEQVAAIMADVFAVVSERRFTAEVGEGATRVLRGAGRVNGIAIEETICLQLAENGLIERIELFVRPLPGLTALAAALGPRLAARRGRARAAATAALLAPLAAMTKHGERLGVKLARP
jgi:hypothetical protein